MNTTIPEIICLLGLGGLLIYAALSDVRRFLIPNWLSLAIAVFFVIYLVFSARPVDWQGGLVSGAAVLGVGFGLNALNLFGGGDVKLLAATALWAGTELILPLLVIMALAGGVLAFTVLIIRYAHSRIGGQEPASNSTTETTAAVRGIRLPYGVAIATGGLYVAAILGLG